MRKMRILSVIVACAVAFCLVGCQKDTGTGQAEQTSIENQKKSAVTEEPSENTELNAEATQQTEKKKTDTKHDWTISQLVAEHLYINGVQFSLPCGIDNIPEEFSLEGEPFESADLNPDYIMDGCLYDGNSIGNIFYYNKRHEKSNEIAVLDIDLENCSEFELYGLNKGDSPEKAVEIFGDPDETIDKSMLHYYYEDDYYIELVFYDICLDSFSVNLSGDMPNDKQ